MLGPITEAWIWFAVVMVIVLSRFISRYIHFGSLRRFQLEDLCMAIVAVLYTVEVNLLVKAAATPTNLVAPEDIPGLTPDSIQLRVYGSKLTIALEQVYCATIWLCKACILLMYTSLTLGLRRSILIKGVIGYVSFGYCLMVVLYFAVWCRPFSDYWSVPAVNPQCSTYMNHLITNLVLNASSDVMIMAIPLPLIAKLNLPFRRKAVLIGVFSLGIFTILCAILNKYYSFTNPYGLDWVYWYTREVSTTVCVANIPHCWALARRIFNLSSFLGNNSSGHSGPSKPLQCAPPMRRRPRALDGFHSSTGSDYGANERDGFPLEIWESKQFQVTLEKADTLSDTKEIGDSVRDVDGSDIMQEAHAKECGNNVITTMITALHTPDDMV